MYVHIYYHFYYIVPSATPLSVGMDVMSSQSILLSWKPPPLEQQNGQLVNYHVLITETQVFYLENGTIITTVGDDI